MTAPEVTPRPRLRRVLGLPSVVLFGLAYMVPLTVFSTFGPVARISDGHVPGAYVVTLICMIFTALSYGSMSRRVPVAGSAYSYAQHSFGGSAGFLTGWALLVDYMLLPMINYMLLGLYLSASFPAVPMWVFFLGALAIVTGLNIAGITSVSRLNTVLVFAQVVFAIAFIGLSIRTLTHADRPVAVFEPFFGGDAQLSAIMTGAAILCLSFLGFDAVSTLSEEAKNPRRTIPWAILLVTGIGGGTFIVLSLFSTYLVPDWRSFADIDTAAHEVVLAAGGELLANLFIAAYIAGALGSALASQAAVTRILYSMGRDRVLPQPLFGVLSARTQTPVRASLVVAAVSLLGLLLPLDFVISIISFGALAGFTMVNLSVLKSYLVDDRERRVRGMLMYGLLPLIGVSLTIWLWTSLPGSALLLGLAWLVIGAVHLIVLSRGLGRRPQLNLEDSL